MLSLDRLGMTTSPQGTSSHADNSSPGTATHAFHRQLDKVDAARAPTPPQAPIASAATVPAAAGGMIFLRRNDLNWLVAFHGIKGLTNSELPLPFDRQESLRDVLAHLAKTYNGQLGGAWLLVAP